MSAPAKRRDATRPALAAPPVEINLTAAIVALADEEPLILMAEHRAAQETALPSGPFNPLAHRTFEIGLREWVREQAGAHLGYVEQLYTFGDRGRSAQAGDRDPHVVSVGYLALTRIGGPEEVDRARFRGWYAFFPWEDWRERKPPIIEDKILPALTKWAARDPDRPNATASRGPNACAFSSPTTLSTTRTRWTVISCFTRRASWRRRAATDAQARSLAMRGRWARPCSTTTGILATAMGRLRAKMKYRPVIFELMAPTFTLTALQRAAEAISGRRLHKQNFRRFVETAAVVEPTGDFTHRTGGRPAALFRFRREVLQERPAAGLRVGVRG